MSGREDKIVNSLKTCILSALIISPFIFFANFIAKFDFPDAVGPANNTSHRVYQNGSDLTTRGDRGGGHGGSAGWALGGNAGNSERFAIGRIGSIRFFNKALSASEANALYTNDTFYT